MKVDRNLGKTEDGRVVERDDPECARVLAVKGTVFNDAEAAKLGITAFYDELKRTQMKQALDAAKAQAAPAPVEAKEVTRDEVEDKAVAGPGEQKPDEDPTRGVMFPPETRRIRGR